MRQRPQQVCGFHTVEVTVSTGGSCETLLLPQWVLKELAINYLAILPLALLSYTPVNAPGKDIHLRPQQLPLSLGSQNHQVALLEQEAAQ